MKQEVEERKQLEQQRKQVEKEEAKYIGEINKVKELLLITDNQDKLSQLNNKIEELQRQLFDVEQKKDDIIKRQNGKAGNVYIISNLGSFGENIFKVGMTRRLEPMDRVKELSDASVPFMFDVHSFIFSDDAVALEQKLHSILEKNRVNKINLRKEFFNVLDLGQYFGHKKVKFLSSLSCKLLTFFRSQIVNRSMNSFAIIPAFYVLK